MKRFLLDTNVFNRLVDSDISILELNLSNVYVTHLQHDELAATPSIDSRAKLLAALSTVAPTEIITEGAAWDVSNWGSKWSASDGVYEALLATIKAGDGAKGRKKSAHNQSRDALTAETVIKAGMVLVTDDPTLADAVRLGGGQAVSFADFIAEPSLTTAPPR